MENVLESSKISKILFSVRAEKVFAPQGTLQVPKILQVWVPTWKRLKKSSFFHRKYEGIWYRQPIVGALGCFKSLFGPKKEYLTFWKHLRNILSILEKFEIFEKNTTSAGDMQKFLYISTPGRVCLCPHILGVGRGYLLRSFKVILCIVAWFCLEGYPVRSPTTKSTDFRPKSPICRNFCVEISAGGCPARPKIFFWTTKLNYFRQKNFHGRTKIWSSSLKNPGGGNGDFPPPNNLWYDLARFGVGC